MQMFEGKIGIYRLILEWNKTNNVLYVIIFIRHVNKWINNTIGKIT